MGGVAPLRAQQSESIAASSITSEMDDSNYGSYESCSTCPSDGYGAGGLFGGFAFCFFLRGFFKSRGYYDLEQLSPELGKTGLSISLRHFQSIPEGGRFAELELPKNFIPKLIDVRAELNGQSKPLQRRFDWPKQ